MWQHCCGGGGGRQFKVTAATVTQGRHPGTPPRDATPIIMNNRNTFEMFDYDKRLKSFKKWPFGSDTGMSKEKMAAAGFYFTGSKKEPDLAKCFVCHKELDGWEEQDDPWEEHKNHSPNCRFTKLNKPESEMLFHEFHEMESERQNNLVAKFVTKKIDEFKRQAEKTREGLQNLI